MAFTLGLAGVYMFERVPALSGEVHVDLPTVASADVFPVFIDKSRTLLRQQNCGKDPADAKARLECAHERLFGARDMSLYEKYEIDRHPSMRHQTRSESTDDRRIRSIIWRHWKEKTRAYVAVHRWGYHGWHTSYYFIEPASDGSWLLRVTYTRAMWLYVVDVGGTEVTYVDPHWTYKQPRWRTATPDDHAYFFAPGTRYLEFENITGDTITF